MPTTQKIKTLRRAIKSSPVKDVYEQFWWYSSMEKLSDEDITSIQDVLDQEVSVLLKYQSTDPKEQKVLLQKLWAIKKKIIRTEEQTASHEDVDTIDALLMNLPS